MSVGKHQNSLQEARHSGGHAVQACNVHEQKKSVLSKKCCQVWFSVCMYRLCKQQFIKEPQKHTALEAAIIYTQQVMTLKGSLPNARLASQLYTAKIYLMSGHTTHNSHLRHAPRSRVNALLALKTHTSVSQLPYSCAPASPATSFGGATMP